MRLYDQLQEKRPKTTNRLPSEPGVYKIENVVTGDFYVGSSINMGTRARGHIDMLRRWIHHSPRLQNAYNKYGEHCFMFSVLELCAKDRHELLKAEQKYLDLLSPEYNAVKIADAPMLGKRHTKESIEKMKNNRDYSSLEFRTKVSNSVKENWKDPVIRKKYLDSASHESRPKKLNKEKVMKIRELWNSGNYSMAKLGELFGVNRYNIYNIVNYRSWKSVP